jgi:hypothetical protein
MSSTSDSSPTGHTITDPATLAGDPFAYAGDKPRGCFACYDGWVFLGFEAEDEDELTERVPCRRCTKLADSPASS